MPTEPVISLEDIPSPREPLVLAIGAFDGLHRGHADIIRHARGMGRRTGVLRFCPHPARVLRPDRAPPLLCTEQQIQNRLAELGVDLHIRLPFNTARAEQEPEAFLEELAAALPGLSGIVVGRDWRFGHRGRGDAGLLQTFAAPRNIEARVLPDTLWNGGRVSTTRIREALAAGRMEEAAAMLGRPYRLTGVISDGKKLGRQLGFPTANFLPDQELVPTPGVYAMRAHLNGAVHPAAGYITHGPPLVEVHLLDCEQNLYGQKLAVDLVSFRRSARPIPDFEALRRRIAEDVRDIRALLEART